MIVILTQCIKEYNFTRAFNVGQCRVSGKIVYDSQSVFTKMLNGSRLQVLGDIQMSVIQIGILVDGHVDTSQIAILHKLSKVGIREDQTGAEDVIGL